MTHIGDNMTGTQVYWVRKSSTLTTDLTTAPNTETVGITFSPLMLDMMTRLKQFNNKLIQSST